MFKNVERMIISKEYTKFNIEYVLIKAKMGIVWELPNYFTLGPGKVFIGCPADEKSF